MSFPKPRHVACFVVSVDVAFRIVSRPHDASSLPFCDSDRGLAADLCDCPIPPVLRSGLPRPHRFPLVPGQPTPFLGGSVTTLTLPGLVGIQLSDLVVLTKLLPMTWAVSSNRSGSATGHHPAGPQTAHPDPRQRSISCRGVHALGVFSTDSALFRRHLFTFDG